MTPLGMICLLIAAQGAPQVTIHFLDVDGRAMIIDAGEMEILIDAASHGRSGKIYRDYLAENKLIDGPIELMISTVCYNNFYGGWLDYLSENPEQAILEFWSTGNPACFERATSRSSYVRLMHLLERSVSRFSAPLADHYPVAMLEGIATPFELEQLPGFTFTIFNSWSENRIKGSRNQKIDNNSLYLRIEFGESSLFVAGNGPGNDRSRLNLEYQLASFDFDLHADLLVAPKLGSPNASSLDFIACIDPEIVLFGKNSQVGYPEREIKTRFWESGSKMFLTDLVGESGRNHVLLKATEGTWSAVYANSDCDSQSPCWKGIGGDGEAVRHNVWKRSPNPRIRGSVLIRGQERAKELCKNAQFQGLNWANRNMRDYWNGFDLTDTDLSGARLERLILDKTTFANTNLKHATLTRCTFKGADLSAANMEFTSFIHCDLENAVLSKSGSGDNGKDLRLVAFTGSNLIGSSLVHADLSGQNFKGIDLSGADLSGARLRHANLRNMRMIGGVLTNADFQGADLTGAVLETDPGKGPNFHDLALASYLTTLKFQNSPHTLIELRSGFRQAGLKRQEREMTYTIEKTITQRSGAFFKALRTLLFEWTCQYGLATTRPLKIILALILAFAPFYLAPLRAESWNGIWRRMPNEKEAQRLRASGWRAAWWAFYFSLYSAFHLGWRDINIGSWISRLQKEDFELKAQGLTRTISGFQSLITVYLLALWFAVSFTQPFG